MNNQHLSLVQLSIKNLRSSKNATIEMSDFTAFVGSNGAGKSTALYALNIFFREASVGSMNTATLTREDFFNGNVDEPIEITLKFRLFSDRAKADLSKYVQDDFLLVSAVAVFDEKANSAIVTQHGVIKGIKEFSEYRLKAETLSVGEMKPIFDELSTRYNLGKASTGKARLDALTAYESEHPELLENVKSTNHFYGFSGSNELAPFVQWIYVPAVKDAGADQPGSKNSAIERLVARVSKSREKFQERIQAIREIATADYLQMVDENQGSLDELSHRLSERLQLFAHPNISVNLKWSADPSKVISIGEPLAAVSVSEFDLLNHSISRCGHGVQRSYIVALLQELAYSFDAEGPTLLLGIEEPELYQHPAQARHLADVLSQIATQGNQVVITTHSPLFVSARDFDSIRHVRRTGGDSSSAFISASLSGVLSRLKSCGENKPDRIEGLLAKIDPELNSGLSEMFFSRHVVLVEGLEDRAYIATHAILNGHWDEMRRQGVAIIPVNGKDHILRPLAILMELGICVTVVFDADSNAPPNYRFEHKSKNSKIFKLVGVDIPDGFPPDNLFESKIIVPKDNLGDMVRAEFDPQHLLACETIAKRNCGNPSNPEKNPTYIASLLCELKNRGLESVSLEKVCQAIVECSRQLGAARE